MAFAVAISVAAGCGANVGFEDGALDARGAADGRGDSEDVGADAGAAETGTPDSSVDSGVPRDESVPDTAARDAGDLTARVPCGMRPCDLATGELCCVRTVIDRQCRRLSCMPTIEITQNCDGPEDCAGGRTCCADLIDSRRPSTCRAECLGPEVVVCHTRADCPPTQQHCCRWPGGTDSRCSAMTIPDNACD